MWDSVEILCYFTSCFVCWHSRLVILKPNSKLSGGRSHILQATFFARGQINNVFRITRQSGMNGVFFCPSGKDLDSTKKFLQRLHLFLSHSKQPLLWWSICPFTLVFKWDGASNSLRFLDRQKAGMMEPQGKNSFNSGLDCKISKRFLIMLPTLGKFGLDVITNGNSLFASFPWVLSKSLAEALENWSLTNLER